jgi:uncharacterized protein (DUF924 family)
MPVAPSHALPPQAAAVLAFWFGPAAGELAPVLRPGWFRRDATFDAAIAAQFLPELESAQAGGLTDWDTAGPQGVLAHVVVLDQFSRNVFRGSPRGFAGDGRALALAKQLVASGADRDLLPEQRLFAYLPFEHSEDLSDQAESLRLFGALAAEQPGLQGLLDYAVAHHKVIAQYGRFPHRNATLGRASTPAELEYLSQPGAGF